ncbi:MAG: hypothetical protein J0L75_17275 [Spirochaetes bacterium]|nr:hypothetical protein [Spirochaetota bacterium]
MHEALKPLGDLLDEDILIRQPLSSFAVKHLAEKGEWVEPWVEAGAADEAIQRCVSHLERSPQAVYALYFLVLLLARTGRNFQGPMEKLFALFAAQKKTALTVYVANEVLRIADSAPALWTLAQIHQHDNNTEELLEAWERLLRLEPDDHVLPLKIGAIKEKLGQRADAVRYTRMAFFRALERKELAEAHDAFKKLVALAPDDLGFAIESGRKLAPLLSGERQKGFWSELIQYALKQGEAQVDRLIALYKEALRLDPEHPAMRDGLISAWRLKYKNHSQLENYLALSGLLRPWKNPAAQMELFEKPIRFDRGSWVCHKSFGYGEIREIQHGGGRGEEALNTARLTIDFTSKKAHAMTLRIALGSLALCAPDDLQAQKHLAPEKFRERLSGPREDLAQAALATLGKPASTADLKGLFVPPLSEEEWTALWKELKAVLERDTRFEIRNKLYALSAAGTGTREELLGQFKGAKDLDVRLKVFDLYLAHFRKGEGAEPMVEDLKKRLSPAGPETLRVLAVLKNAERSCGLKAGVDLDAILVEATAAPGFVEAFDAVKTPAHRLWLLEQIPRKCPETFAAKYVELFLSPSAVAKGKILEILSARKREAELKALVQKVDGSRLQYPEQYLLLARHALFHPAGKNLGLEKGVLFLRLVEHMRYAYGQAAKDPAATAWKRTLSGCQTLLFTEGNLFEYLRGNEAAPHRKAIFDQLGELQFLENYLRLEIKELSTKLVG